MSPLSARSAPPPRPGARLTVAIEDLTSEGAGVARADGWVVFVPGAVPGDRAEVRVGRVRRGVVEAALVALRGPSPARVDPPCPFQAACGGCPLMVLAPDAQQALKVRHLEQTLRRIGGLAAPEVALVIPSPHALRYRGRVRFAISPRADGPAIGFHPRGAAGAIVAVDDCRLAPEAASRLAQRLVARLDELSPGDGYWPLQVEARGSFAADEWLLVLFGPPGEAKALERASRELVAAEPQLAGIVRVEGAPGDGGREALLAGRDELLERIGAAELELGATTFLQVNPSAAAALYGAVRRMLAQDGPPGRLLDLFCGVGAIGLLGVDAPCEVLGVESHPATVERARRSARRAGRDGVTFLAGDAQAVTRALAAAGERFDAVTANPPRAGLGPDLPRAIAALGPRRVVLVSCHPATLARDLRAFAAAGFEPGEIAAVDLFPQTPHLEAVVRLVPREVPE